MGECGSTYALVIRRWGPPLGHTVGILHMSMSCSRNRRRCIKRRNDWPMHGTTDRLSGQSTHDSSMHE